ncbi:hypothetical protein D3G38_26260 [Escherichia coli]|nr:hypothetical protein [Escherichia coli]
MLSVINGKVFLFSVFALFTQFSEFAFCWFYLMCITFYVLFFCEKKVRKNAFRRSFMLQIQFAVMFFSDYPLASGVSF